MVNKPWSFPAIFQGGRYLLGRVFSWRPPWWKTITSRPPTFRITSLHLLHHTQEELVEKSHRMSKDLEKKQGNQRLFFGGKKKTSCFLLEPTLRIFGPSNAWVRTCIAGVRALKIAIFEGSGFLGQAHNEQKWCFLCCVLSLDFTTCVR